MSSTASLLWPFELLWKRKKKSRNFQIYRAFLSFFLLLFFSAFCLYQGHQWQQALHTRFPVSQKPPSALLNEKKKRSGIVILKFSCKTHHCKGDKRLTHTQTSKMHVDGGFVEVGGHIGCLYCTKHEPQLEVDSSSYHS